MAAHPGWMRRFWLVGLVFMVGCGPPRINTTRLQAADLIALTDAMAASLLTAPVIAGRDAEAPPMVIVTDRITNRSDHFLPRSEQWAFMNRLRALLNHSRLLDERNMVFVLSRRQAEALGERHAADVQPDRTQPTHALTATLHSVTRHTRRQRSDMYLADFTLLDLQSNEILWEDTYEVKYAVERNRLD